MNAVHHCRLTELHTPYIVPSENGSRADTTWLEILRLSKTETSRREPRKSDDAVDLSQSSDKIVEQVDKETFESTVFMKISATRPFNFSAQCFTTEDLALCRHNTFLQSQSREFVCVNLDPYLMGLGGDDSWSKCVHEEHLIPPSNPRSSTDKYDFEFKFSFDQL